MSDLPDRLNVSIPTDNEHDLDLDLVDEAVERSEYATRSAFVRAALVGEVSVEDVLDLDS